MIYLVSNQTTLSSFFDEYIQPLSKEEALALIKEWKHIQFDTETTGRDARICNLLCAQFGSPDSEIQIVVDTSTIDIRYYKEVLENKLIIGQNLKFDIKFLYNYGIIPRKVYDTMIVEQFLHLGYPTGTISYSLKEIAWRRLNINLDKTVRGEIIWRGLDREVIHYAASDVKYITPIMKSQIEDLRKIPNAFVGAKIECDFVPSIAYLEWCGIKLDEKKWKAKMVTDEKNLQERTKALNDFVIKNNMTKYYRIEKQGDLFSGFSTDPIVTINWSSSKQVINIAKDLGFNTQVKDKKTGEDKDSVLEKHLSTQKGINDEFLKLYFEYQESAKVVSSFGQGHLNAINPKTGRLHTEYRAIGTKSGRMSCGSNKPNTELAKLKGIPAKECSFCNMQQLPHDKITRSCFIAEKGNLFCSCDWSAMEARIGAEVYNEKKLLDEFLYGSGDTHAAYAKAVWPDILQDIPTTEIKAKRPDLRNEVKKIEFAVQFGSDGTAVAPQLGISVEEARQLVSNLLEGMIGLKKFKEEGSKRVRQLGYVEILPQTGHRIYWYGWKDWKQEQASYTSEFWEEYKTKHKGTGDYIAQQVKKHFKIASTWDRLALNGPTQGGGAVLLKEAVITLFNWIIDNNYFGKILLVNLTHDEINSEFPKELEGTYPKMVSEIMENVGKKYYHKLPIPAEASVGDHWIH